MNILNYNNTLINQLTNIVDAEHLDEVKRVIDALTQVSNFKYDINSMNDVNAIYKATGKMLKNKFNISSFMIKQIIHNIDTIQYKSDECEIFEYSFSVNCTKDSTMEIHLNNSHLDEFDILLLNNYLNEAAYTLYIQLVLLALQESSQIDHLTQLKNRVSFQQDMTELIPLALREKMKIGVLLINIDRFRAVNDEHGTHFGDEFLKLYAKTIKDITRTSDIVIRFGGGEFLVLLMNIINDDKTMEIANHIKDTLSDTFLMSPNKDEFKKTVCIGVSMFPEDSQNMDEVVQNAEQTLSDAKDTGRNQVLRFQPDDGEFSLF